MIKILCLGDLVGKPGRNALEKNLDKFIEDNGVDFVVCNGENAASGSGLTPKLFDNICHSGVDVITLGDHVFRRREVIPLLEKSKRVIRPANLSPMAAGKGWTVLQTKSASRQVGVVCALGQMYMKPADSPWAAVDKCLSAMDEDVKIRVVDFHAEATSEKVAMGWHLNGRASIVFGTHTHVPTADARILDGGTAYISDVGMTGPYDGVLGRRKDRVLSALLTSMPKKFDIAEGDVRMCGILVSVDGDTGKAQSIERIEVADGE